MVWAVALAIVLGIVRFISDAPSAANDPNAIAARLQPIGKVTLTPPPPPAAPAPAAEQAPAPEAAPAAPEAAASQPAAEAPAASTPAEPGQASVLGTNP
jgi:hypothetical protein